MKKLFIYITALIVFAACSSEHVAVEQIEQEDVKENGQFVTVESLDMDETLASRSSLYYLYTEKNTVFSWAEGDQIGVFPVALNTNEMDKPEKKSQAMYDVLGGNSSELRRKFAPAAGVQPIASSTEYVACHPTAVVGKIGYTDIPFDYLGQVQSAPVEMYYYPFSANSNKDEGKYIASEKAAAAHLSPKDYLASLKQSTDDLANILFDMKRMGAVVRFYIKAPNKLNVEPKQEIIFDELQLANSTTVFPGFMTKGFMNLDTHAYENAETSRVLTLSFGTGLDMTATSKCVYNNVGYIVAYMMMAPIDLTSYDACVLYLVGHDKEDKDKKYYYKATGLAKPNLTPNKFYQWTVANANEDTPIEFDEITVEEWREGTTFYNGDKGNGTSKW